MTGWGRIALTLAAFTAAALVHPMVAVPIVIAWAYLRLDAAA